MDRDHPVKVGSIVLTGGTRTFPRAMTPHGSDQNVPKEGSDYIRAIIFQTEYKY